MTEPGHTNPRHGNALGGLPEEWRIHRVDHLPVVSEYCRRLNLVETINSLVPSEMHVDPGTIVQGLVLDTLSGRSPLYRLEEFFAQQDAELLLGKAIAPGAFSDTNVGRTMDRIYRAGTTKIFSAIGVQASRQFDVQPRYTHFDTTSVSVWGDYDV
jgi:transposase